MEQQLNLDQPKQVKLTEADQGRIVKFVVETWDQGVEARRSYQEGWDACDKAYKQEPKPIEDEEMQWAFNLVLPWARDAVDSWYAHVHSTLMPSQDKVFTISGRTTEDHPGATVMEKYLEYCYERFGFTKQLGKSLMQLARKNHTCVKTYWRKDKRVEHAWEVGEDGIERRVPKEQVTYNGVYYDTVPIEDFVFFPIHGDINKTTRIHRTYRYLEELKEAERNQEAPYINLHQINEREEKRENHENKERDGVELKEAWIHRVKIGDKVYKNYVATIANDKHLIRFQPNPYANGDSPFTFLALNPDGNCLYGYGLNSPGLPLLDAGNYIFNQRLNELAVKMYGPYTYNKEDSVFNPYTFVSTPGALVGVGRETDLKPLAANLQHLQLAYAEVAELKSEFESVTVPKVVKGQQEARDATATEIAHVQNNSSGKMHVQAFHINDELLKPLLERGYSLIYQKSMEDPSVKEEIARVTQKATTVIEEGPNGEPLPPMEVEVPLHALVQSLPQFLPLPEVDVKVVGYQSTLQKQEQLESTRRLIAELAETPAAKYLKWDNLPFVAFRLTGLDPDELVMDDEERQALDEQEQQAQQAAQEQAQQLQDLEIQKEMIKLQNEQERIRLEQMKVELKARELELKYTSGVQFLDQV